MSDLTLLNEPERHRLDVFKSWLPRIGIGLLFVIIGQSKFSSDPRGEWFQIFEKIGLGQWLRYLTGVMQVTGGILLLMPRTMTVGAVMLACTKVGAAFVDLFVLGGPFFIPLFFLAAIAMTWLVSR